MYRALSLDLTEDLPLNLFDPLLTLVFLACDNLLDQLRILLLLRHHGVVDDLLLLVQLLLEDLSARTVSRCLQILLRLLLILSRGLRLVGLDLLAKVGVEEVRLLDLRKVGEQLLLLKYVSWFLVFRLLWRWSLIILVILILLLLLIVIRVCRVGEILS